MFIIKTKLSANIILLTFRGHVRHFMSLHISTVKYFISELSRILNEKQMLKSA